MKKTILEKSGEVFLKYGFKTATMDDIANELAISKKTIYKYFKNKEQLVDESVLFFHNNIHNSILCICNKGYNAIEENFEVKIMFKDIFKNLNESPVFQLQKYYPKTYEKVMSSEFEMFKDCISENIKKGIKEGLYRKDINESVISRFYFSLVFSVYDTTLFTQQNKTLNQLEIEALEYHTRAIATDKGIKILEKQLEKI
ncbi:MAG: TetR/AcrR family transcriptional regulator [Lutibacter sp.]|uniref:TetR/AcrR family transcriptional regulator n=1 Tax=Lutibacter sp. TaxID=1925666 RepID=UPI00299E2C0A|nr:TetR/AcrR family transcriptional regulator [Lutibacter sp.]MDX1829480.1 TetR/AcrR family transcriptional regulator [Lutibacter sp.]